MRGLTNFYQMSVSLEPLQEIIASATRKLVDFIKSHLLEPRVAAHLAASLVRVFVRIAGAEMRKLFVPYVIDTINAYIDDHGEDIANIEKQSDELLYYIILLASTARGDPNEVIVIVPDIIPIIDRLSKYKCKLTNKYSNAIIMNILSNVSTLQTLDVRSSPDSYEKPLKEYLPIRHWGEKVNADTKIKWYTPHRRARDVCEMIVHRYLPPILAQFQGFVRGDVPLTRDEILRDSATVLALLKCGNLLPNWCTEEPLRLVDSECEPDQLDITLGFDEHTIEMPDGGNVRLAVIKTFTGLQDKILKESEDDIKSLRSIVMIWDAVHMRRHYTTTFDAQLKSYKSLKVFQEYLLTSHPRDIRAILATRVIMQQDCRDELTPPAFTESHRTIMFNLLRLGTSHYSTIRAVSQAKLFSMIHTYSFSYKCILDEIVRYIGLDSNENHESFKGILYVIGGTRKGRMVVRNNWTTVQKIWLALLKTNLSEKPSVVRLGDMILEAIHNEFPTVSIELEIPDKCVELALTVAVNNDVVTAADIETGLQRLQQSNARNLRTYHEILNSILEITHNRSLHWRYGLMASSMIYNLIHPNVKYPPNVAQYCVQNLINESIEERKIALQCVRYILKQQKREHPKIQVDPFEISGCKRPPPGTILPPGIRDDNRWLQYDMATVPQSQAEWDAPKYSHKTEGYFGWRRSFAMYAPSADQPRLDRARDELNDVERIVYDFFANEENVTKMIGFWSLEDKKGKEKLSRSRLFVVKHLCDMFGDRFVDQFLAHIKRLIMDTKNLEANHRCSAELMSGIMRGMKHWSYDLSKRTWERLQPLVRLALESITVETDTFWGTCFASASEHFDPKKQYWLHEVS